MSMNGYQDIAQLAAARLLDSLVDGVVLAALAALLVMVTRRYGARLRFVIWFSVLMAMIANLMLPLFWPSTAAAPAHLHLLTFPASWGGYLFAFWTVIAVGALARIGFALWRVHELRRTCVSLDLCQLPLEVQQTLAAHSRRGITLCTSPAIDTPTTLGFFRPAIVIPAALVRELSPADLNHVLLHELAHVRRWDDWTNLAQKLAGALLFFHPLVWWIERRIAWEREMACDEAVVAATANPRAYAECLAFLAERGFVRRSLQLVQAAVGRMRQTTARVARILGGTKASAVPMWKAAVPAVVLFVSASSALIVHMPDVVAFKNSGMNLAAGDATNMVGAATAIPTATATKASAALEQRARPTLAKYRTAQRAVSTAAARTAAGAPHVPGVVTCGDVVGPCARLATSTAPRLNRPAPVRGDIVLVVFEEGQQSFAGTSAWQVQVWQVTLIRQITKAETSSRKIT